MVARAADAALQFGVNDGFGAFQARLEASISSPGNFRAQLMGLEFLETGHHYLCQVALAVTIGDLDRFIQLAFAQRAGDGRSKLPGLLAGAR